MHRSSFVPNVECDVCGKDTVLHNLMYSTLSWVDIFLMLNVGLRWIISTTSEFASLWGRSDVEVVENVRSLADVCELRLIFCLTWNSPSWKSSSIVYNDGYSATVTTTINEMRICLVVVWVPNWYVSEYVLKNIVENRSLRYWVLQELITDQIRIATWLLSQHWCARRLLQCKCMRTHWFIKLF